MARIGILKNDTVVFQTHTGDYCGGTVYEVGGGHALIETTDGLSVERPERELYLLTTPKEQTEQLELTESLEEQVRVANCKIRELESELSVVRRELREAQSPFKFKQPVEWGGTEWPYQGEYRGSTPDGEVAFVWMPAALVMKNVAMSDLRAVTE